MIKEDLLDNTNIFSIEAHLPVVEAFGLSDELRIKTSGHASTPQLVFSHWDVLDVNPFFRATSEEELEEFGHTGWGACACVCVCVCMPWGIAHPPLAQVR